DEPGNPCVRPIHHTELGHPARPQFGQLKKRGWVKRVFRGPTQHTVLDDLVMADHFVSSCIDKGPGWREGEGTCTRLPLQEYLPPRRLATLHRGTILLLSLPQGYPALQTDRVESLLLR